MLNTLLIILSGILIGGMYLSAKKFSNDKFSPFTFTAIYALLCMAFALPVIGVQFELPTDTLHWVLAFLSPISFALGNMFAYKAYVSTDASTVGLLGRFSIVITAILGALLLRENVTMFALLGLLFTLIGGMFMLYRNGKIELKQGIVASLLMAFFYGLTAVLDKVVIEQFSPFTYVFFNNLIVFLVFYFAVRDVRQELFAAIRANPTFAVLTSFLGATGWLAFLYGIQAEIIAVAFPLSDTLSLITTVLLGIYLLGEKDRQKSKYLGMVLAIVGSFLLTM